MRFIRILLIPLSVAFAFGQEAIPTPTPEQLIEKSIAAEGGREAMKKITSLVGTGTLEIPAMGVNAAFEMYAKAPDKRLTVTVVEGYGEIRRGFDGKTGWNSEPQNGLVDLAGEELATEKREAVFFGDLRWKELYPTAEVAGRSKVGARECWILKLTPSEGRPVTRYYDAETRLMVKSISTSAAGEIEAELSDFRDIGAGVKIPHTMKMTTPNGDVVLRFKEWKTNVEIDDAKFAKPRQ